MLTHSNLRTAGKPEPEYFPDIIHGLLRPGEMVTFIETQCPLNDRISWASLDLAVSLACGLPFWNLTTRAVPVLYMNCKIPGGLLSRDRILPIASRHGLKNYQLNNLILWNLWKAPLVPEHLFQLDLVIKGSGALVLIVDPSSGMPKAHLDEVSALAKSNGVACIITLDHFKSPDLRISLTPSKGKDSIRVKVQPRDVAPYFFRASIVGWSLHENGRE